MNYENLLSYIIWVAFVVIASFLFNLFAKRKLKEDLGLKEAYKDENDPRAQADIYVAMGDFKNAAEVVEEATLKHSGNVDYVVKLLEIYFIWGKKRKFIDTAQMHKALLESTGNWHEIEILRKEL